MSTFKIDNIGIFYELTYTRKDLFDLCCMMDYTKLNDFMKSQVLCSIIQKQILWSGKLTNLMGTVHFKATFKSDNTEESIIKLFSSPITFEELFNGGHIYRLDVLPNDTVFLPLLPKEEQY